MAKADNKKEKKVALPQSYTVTSMAAYLAESKELSKKDAKEILELVFNMVEAGVLQGERVPIGKIGKVFAKVRPATKARKGRNPLTGEEMTIPARKRQKSPNSHSLKDLKKKFLKQR